MKLGIRLHLAGLSLLNTISELEKFGVDRSRKAVHDWVQKAILQPVSGKAPNPCHAGREGDSDWW